MTKALIYSAGPYLRTLVGVVFLIAAALKYTMITTTQYGPRGGIEAFAATIARGEVFPQSFSYPLAVFVFWVEVIVGLALLTHLAPKLWASIASMMLLLMTTYLVFLQMRGKAPSCGCLGQWDTSIPVGIARNAALSLACLPTLITRSPLTAPPTGAPRNTEPATRR